MSLGDIASAASGAAKDFAGDLAGNLLSAVTDDYSTFRRKYADFLNPEVEIKLRGRVFDDKEKTIIINDIEVELTSEYEASVASFRIYNCWNKAKGEFKLDNIKKSLYMGATLEICLGYLGKLETVFVGFVAGINFKFSQGGLPYIEVIGMDAKGIMMSNNYVCQLKSHNYGDAVREILTKTAYKQLETNEAIRLIKVTDTPDKASPLPIPGGLPIPGDLPIPGNLPIPGGVPPIPGGVPPISPIPQLASAYTIEMNAESDYDFIVKAAKKWNYEFFIDRGNVYFRKAKSNTFKLMNLAVSEGVTEFDVGYSITGMVGAVEARAMDPATGKLIKAKARYQSNLSTNNKAKALIRTATKVYIDNTIMSKAQATARADSLMERAMYRLGNFECRCIGIPELVPGRFIGFKGLGTMGDNKYYLTNVTHSFNMEQGYSTKLIGKAMEVKVELI